MKQEAAPKNLLEKGLQLNNRFDKVMLVGGAVVGLTINPLLGGAIIGGSIISMEAGKRIGQEISKPNRRQASLKLGRSATKASL